MSTMNILSATLIALILAACAALFLGVQAASAEGSAPLSMPTDERQPDLPADLDD